MELILVPFGIVVAVLLVVGAVTGAAFKFVWIVLRFYLRTVLLVAALAHRRGHSAEVDPALTGAWFTRDTSGYPVPAYCKLQTLSGWSVWPSSP